MYCGSIYFYSPWQIHVYTLTDIYIYYLAHALGQNLHCMTSHLMSSIGDSNMYHQACSCRVVGNSHMSEGVQCFRCRDAVQLAWRVVHG